MTSEFTHGREYDTYHYAGDKSHLQQHFTVTRPDSSDIVSKGSYYHAKPQDVSRSYPHHHVEHVYEVEHVPFHHSLLGPEYAVDYPAYHHAYDYGVDANPHFDEEEHAYSGEAKDIFWPTRDHKYGSETNQSGAAANLFPEAFHGFHEYSVTLETKSDHFRSAEDASEPIFEHKY